MEPSLWSIFVVNVGVNSLLSFFTISLLIFLSLKLLRIKHARIQAICLFIPFIKLIVDLASYQFSNWALAQQLNPLTSPEGTRILSVSFLFSLLKYPLCSIGLHLQEGQTFTVADLLCLKMGPFWTMCCAVTIVGGTMMFLGRAILHYQISCQWARKMQNSSQLCLQTIQDPFLQIQIQRKKAAIYLSETPHTPCIIGYRHPSIFLPRSLFEQLTMQEFEAVVAHEMAHLHHGDMIVNTCLFWICYCFWWIPTSYLKKKLELSQEYACDNLHNTNLHQVHLAEALYKAARWLHSSRLPPLAHPLAASHNTKKRLQALLALPARAESKILKWIKFLFLFGWTATLIFGKFWTF